MLPSSSSYAASLGADNNATMHHGIFGQPNQSTGFMSITDGTSNTFMTGELQRITTKTSSGPFNASTGPEYSHDGWAIGGDATLFSTAIQYPSGGSLLSNGDFRAPGSEHNGSTNFGMADGSVKLISNSMTADVFSLLGSMADRAPAQLTD